MNKQQVSKLFDPKNIAAVEFLAAEDTDTVLAIWLRMLVLAANDPEGCVRLTPGLHMEPAELAEYFHCTAEALEATIQILEQLQQLTREADGTLKLTACSGLLRRSKTKKATAAASVATISGATSATTHAANTVTNSAAIPIANNNTVSAATEKETEKEKRKEPKEKSKEKNKKADIADAMNSAREPETTESKTEAQPAAAAAERANKKENFEAASTAMPQPASNFQTNSNAKQPQRKNKKLIPTADLAEPVQQLLTAWNRLPLDNKFEGLYPAMLEQVQSLLERYGEEALRKAIDNVAHSDFLLGKSPNNRGWSISFGWLLNPEHLENILQGKYQNKKPRGESLLFQPGDEQEPYSNGFYGTVVD